MHRDNFTIDVVKASTIQEQTIINKVAEILFW